MKKIIISLFCVLIIISCENGLIGLGEKIDIDLPGISVGKYADGSTINNGDYVRETIVLSGNISDDIGVSSVKVTIADSSTSEITIGDAVIDYSSMTWSFSIDTTSFSDGEKDITIEVIDTSSKSDTTQRLLYFDNTAPMVLVKEPVDYNNPTGLTNSIVTLKGETIDQFNIASVDVQLISGEGSVDDIDPENAKSGSWTSYLRSTGTGDYIISVTATDYAGNTSTGFYHTDDIYEANNDEYITASDIYDILVGNIVPTSGLILDDLQNPALLLTQLPLTIDLAGDEPQITISNPDPLAMAVDNVLPGNSKAIGSIVDDDSVNVASIAVSIDSAAFVPVSSTSGSGLFVQWEHDLSGLGSGAHTIQIYVEDGFGVYSYSSIVDFIVNLGAPVVAIGSPVLGDYINVDSFTVTGTATDGEGITDVEISLDNGTTWSDVIITPSTDVTWSYNTPSLSDGVKTIKVRASDDNKSTWSYSNTQMTIDTEVPITSFISPSANGFVNGEITIRGASSDNTSILKTEIKVGDSRDWVELDDALKYNWTYDINSLEYENGSDAQETSSGSGIYKLEVYSRVTDIAGNVTETVSGDYSFLIDNALDRPTVNIIAPSDGANLGGSVIVSGTSYDDDGEVFGVYMQIDVNTISGNEPDFADSVNLGVNGIDFDGTGGDAPVTVIDESQWYLVEGKSPWNVELNTNGELYSTETGHSGEIYIRVRAVDKDGGSTSITGEYKQHSFRMDNTIPFIENLDPVTNSYVKDTFTLTGNVVDETQIKHLELSYNGGADYYYIIEDGIIQSPYGSGSVSTGYTLNLDVDTLNIPDVGTVTSDDITLRLKVTDSTYYYTLYSLNYFVDNTDPYGWLTQNIEHISGSEDDATISGRANDSGEVSGVEKIVAYFEKDGNFYDLRDGSFTAVTTDSVDGEIITYPTSTEYQVVIDSTSETLSGSNEDGDGINEELNLGTNYEWKFNFDSTLVPDGPFTFHYVVFDNSGNAEHYTEPGYVKNNEPVINSIVLSTDLNADGDNLDSNESITFTSSYGETYYTVKNNRLNITVNASGGNGTLRYSMKYGSLEKNGTLTDNSLLITDFTGMADDGVNGSTFEIEVFDSTVSDDNDDTNEISDLISLSLTLDNIDETPPLLNIAEFGRHFNQPASGVYTDKMDIAVDNYEDNIVVNGNTLMGHIEYASDSLFDNGISDGDGTDDDTDVSGKIVFKGKVWDDQRIQRISVIIDPDGIGPALPEAEFTVATWSGNGLVGQSDTNWDFNVESGTEELSIDNGHNLNWDFEWNSASMTDVVGKNITVTFKVYDFGTGSVTDMIQIDVVPYITSVENNSSIFGLSNDVIRSSTGKYSIDTSTDASNYYNINGFNFDNTDLNINITPTIITVPVTDTGDIRNINSEIRNTSSDLIEMNKDISKSGYLTVFVNSIPTINNFNDDTLSQNREYTNVNPRSYMWTDNRYFHTWNTTQVLTSVSNTTFYYPSMVMNGDQPLFSYTNDNNGSTNRSTGDESRQQLGTLWYERQTAYDLDSDGNHYVISAQDAFSGGSIGYLYLGRRSGSAAAAYGGNNRNNFIELIGEDYNSRQLNRFRYPQLIVDGPATAARTYTAVYDAHPDEKDIKFFAFEMTGQASSNLNEPGNDSSVAANGYISVPGTQDGASSQYFDMTKIGDATSSTHKIAIAYYDESSSGLKVKFAVNPVDSSGLYNSGTTWHTLEVEGANSYAGTYVSAVNDGTDLYLSYYDSASANLKMAVIPGTLLVESGASGSISTFTIDSYLSVGSWTNITMIGTTPYISYYSDSYNGTKSPIRIAYPISGIDHGVINGADNEYNGNWEIAAVPALSSPLGGMAQFNRTMINKDSSNAPVVGWLGSRIEYAKLLNP